MDALHGAGLLEPPVPHLDLGELVLGVRRTVGARVLQHSQLSFKNLS